MLRDGVWAERDAEILVPGDIISIKLGDIVPADARLLEGDPLKIDQVWSRTNFQLEWSTVVSGNDIGPVVRCGVFIDLLGR